MSDYHWEILGCILILAEAITFWILDEMPSNKKFNQTAPMQSFLRKLGGWFLSPVPTKAETFGTTKLAILFALLLVLFPIGLAMFDVQQKFALGLICWLAFIGTSIYIFWVWEKTAGLTRLAKLLSSFGIAMAIMILIWSPAKNQYRKERALRSPHPLAAPTLTSMVAASEPLIDYTEKKLIISDAITPCTLKHRKRYSFDELGALPVAWREEVC